MSNYSTGHEAEKRAAVYLQQHGFRIVAMNWKTRYCEIDIIAEKKATVHFVEVKYRRNSMQGSGLDYITSRKLKQMRFAAEMWVSQQQWNGAYQLAALSIDHQSVTFIDSL